VERVSLYHFLAVGVVSQCAIFFRKEVVAIFTKLCVDVNSISDRPALGTYSFPTSVTPSCYRANLWNCRATSFTGCARP